MASQSLAPKRFGRVLGASSRAGRHFTTLPDISCPATRFALSRLLALFDFRVLGHFFAIFDLRRFFGFSRTGGLFAVFSARLARFEIF